MSDRKLNQMSRLCGRVCVLGVGFVVLTGALSPAQAANTGGRDEAITWYEKTVGDECRPYSEAVAFFDNGREEMPARYEMQPTDESGNLKKDGRSTIVYAFFCDAGAYNQNFVYVHFNAGLYELLSFPQPTIAVKNETEDPDSAIKSITITGFSSRLRVVNPTYDPKTRTLKETGYWRGIGDASNEAWWVFNEGRFVLKRYRVDASYDGDVNPQFDMSWPTQK